MAVDWTDPAKRDLRRIFDFCRKQSGETYAQKVSYQIHSEAHALGQAPFIAAKEQTLEEHSEGFRSLVVRRRYKVIYFVVGDNVTIVAVWDCRRSPVSLRKIFFGERD